MVLAAVEKIISKNVVGGPLAAGVEIYWATCLQRLRTTDLEHIAPSGPC